MKCEHCGKEHPDDFQYCPTTGLKLEAQFHICSNPDCNFRKPLPANFKFCPNCGKELPVRLANSNSKLKGQLKFDTAEIQGCVTELLSLRNAGMYKSADMSGMFKDKKSLTDLDLSEFDTAGTTNMREMFSGCSALETLDLKNFDTTYVTDMTRMFSNCSSLSALDLSGFDTSKVSFMGGLFKGCSSLKAIDLSGWDTTLAVDVPGVLHKFPFLNKIFRSAIFRDCLSLKTIKMTNCNDRTIDSIKAALNDAELSNIEIIR